MSLFSSSLVFYQAQQWEAVISAACRLVLYADRSWSIHPLILPYLILITASSPLNLLLSLLLLVSILSILSPSFTPSHLPFDLPRIVLPSFHFTLLTLFSPHFYMPSLPFWSFLIHLSEVTPICSLPPISFCSFHFSIC